MRLKSLVTSAAAVLALCAITVSGATNETGMKLELAVDGRTNVSTATFAATNSLTNLVNAMAGRAEKDILLSTNLLPPQALPPIAEFAKTNLFPVLTNSAMPEIVAAAGFLKDLKMKGQLPGVPKDSHGEFVYSPPSDTQLPELKYPFTTDFLCLIEGNSFTNHYTATRAAKDGIWRLQKAWRTDAQGKSILEWSTK